jgi:uncharacterized protein
VPLSADDRAEDSWVGNSDHFVVETHTAVLLFFDDLVLKFKKPVHFPFVDLRDRAQRLRACEAEVDANRRLSPDVYLGVADVCMGEQILDHGVVLRRLPGECSLGAMARRGHPQLDEALEKVAVLLAGFHERADRSPKIDSAATPEAVCRLWENCFEVLRASAGRVLELDKVDAAEALALRYVEGRSALFAERISLGRICDGHGDLLASDVFMVEDGPRVLDCIEFDPELRHVDVIADVAFLVMDLEHLGAANASEIFVRAYERASGDTFPPTLLDHYCAERAVVRSEVAALRVHQGAQSEAQVARELLDLALWHLHRGRVVLGVVSGLPGTGKSTIASMAGKELGWPVLRSDELRMEIVNPGSRVPLVGPFDEGPYSAQVTERTYDLMLERACIGLERGRSVLLDATFTNPLFRQRVETLAAETASDLIVLECSAPADVAAGRIRSRRRRGSDLSGADEAVAEQMSVRSQQWTAAVKIDTGEMPLRACVVSVLEHLVGDRPG